MAALGTHTPAEWAHDFLVAAGFPATSENLRAVISWEYAESGNPPNAAMYNPLNTTQKMAGSTNFNNNGGYPVQNMPDYQSGIFANAKVIHNGYYPAVVAALQAGNNAQAVVDAVVKSPWGTRAINLIPAAPVPAPPPVEKVHPMYNPAMHMDIVAACAYPPGGTLLLDRSGRIIHVNGGGIAVHEPMAAWNNGGPRQGARIQAINYGNAVFKKWGYRVTATSGEGYDYRPGA